MGASRSALVTGASSGIGWAVATRLARAGYRTFGTSRSPGATGPAGVVMLELDVTQDASCVNCVERAVGDAGGLDLIVNNAGVAFLGALEETSLAELQALLDVNLLGAFRMAMAALPHMRSRRRGRIVNVSSVSGFLPGPFSGAYAISKHALEAFSEALDHEVRTLGLRSILVEPAFTATGIGERTGRPQAPLAAYDAGREAVVRAFDAALALAAPPETVAEVVLTAACVADPRVRYTVGRRAGALRALRRLLPARLFERSFRKQFGLPAA
jgi:NAD(P)-dependent dehydrogenase (short-subunit alcohol dehydrogenase family)